LVTWSGVVKHFLDHGGAVWRWNNNIFSGTSNDGKRWKWYKVTDRVEVKQKALDTSI